MVGFCKVILLVLDEGETIPGVDNIVYKNDEINVGTEVKHEAITELLCLGNKVAARPR